MASSAEFKYTADRAFFNPLATALENLPKAQQEHTQKKGKKEWQKGERKFVSLPQPTVYRDTKTCSPVQPLSWKHVTDQLSRENPANCKLIYVTRHAQAEHNVEQEAWGKAVLYELLAGLPGTREPALTANGKTQALEAVEIIRQSGAPLPESVYSSPLRRCFSTAIMVMSGLRPGQAPIIHLKEDLREWMGWDHNHESDARGTIDELRQWAVDSGGQVKVDASFTKQDDKFNKKPLREVYTDVDQRMRHFLDQLFTNDRNGCVQIFLHNRCFRSFLRAVGHQPYTEEFNVANAVVVPFLVRRTKLTPAEANERRAREQQLKDHDKGIILGEKAHLKHDADLDVLQMPTEMFEELKALLKRKNAHEQLTRVMQLRK